MDAAVTPNPAEQWRECNRPSRSRVCDADGLLSPAAADRLDAVADEVERQHGFQVRFAVVRFVKSSGPRATAAEAEAVARRLHERWGVGHAGEGDGVMVLASVDDRHIVISTGGRAWQRLSENDCSEIAASARRRLRRDPGDYDGALIKLGERVAQRLSSDHALAI
eukprot:tig00001042_g6588.t1